MSEQDKPIRKTWTMLKKAVHIEDFNFGNNGSIIPLFSTGITQKENQYGLWKISGPSGSRFEMAFDGQNGYFSVLGGVSTYDIFVDVPEGKSICPSVFSTYQQDTTFKVTVYGWESKTAIWENLGTIHGTAVFNVNTEKYYTRFKLNVWDTDNYGVPRISEFRLCAGKIKKG